MPHYYVRIITHSVIFWKYIHICFIDGFALVIQKIFKAAVFVFLLRLIDKYCLEKIICRDPRDWAGQIRFYGFHETSEKTCKFFFFQ